MRENQSRRSAGEVPQADPGPTRRVLLVAEQCNPSQVSVPLVGWSLARSLGEHPAIDAHLVTQVRNGDAIRSVGWREGQEFTTIDTERVAAPLHKLSVLLRGGRNKGWTTVMAIRRVALQYFETRVWGQFGTRIAGGHYDVVHRVTPVSPTVPSPLARRCARAGTPLLVGPLNGGLPWPRGFDATRRREREWLSYVRSGYRLAPGYRSTLKHVAALLVGSRATWSQLPARVHDKSIYLPENAVRAEALGEPRTSFAGPLSVVFVGRLVPYKGADMLLEAMADGLRRGSTRLEIVGDGPERPRLEALARSLDVEGRVRFRGWIEHGGIPQVLAEADILGFPSVREFGGGVVLEAMAAGVVPVVVDYGGPGELVTEATGFRVPMASRTEIVASLRETLSRVIADATPLPALSAAARERVRTHFTWPAKAEQIKRVYDWLVEGGPKPDFEF